MQGWLAAFQMIQKHFNVGLKAFRHFGVNNSSAIIWIICNCGLMGGLVPLNSVAKEISPADRDIGLDKQEISVLTAATAGSDRVQLLMESNEGVLGDFVKFNPLISVQAESVPEPRAKQPADGSAENAKQANDSRICANELSEVNERLGWYYLGAFVLALICYFAAFHLLIFIVATFLQAYWYGWRDTWDTIKFILWQHGLWE